jgi:hypothetical protein
LFSLTANIVSDKPIPNTIFNGDLKIAWTVTRTAPGVAQTEVAPGSFNHLYVQGGLGNVETVLDVGCRSANGIDPANHLAVLDSIWGTFATNHVVAADGATVMRYFHDTPSGITTASLVNIKRGRCGAWGRFFVDVLAAQAVTAQAIEIVPPQSTVDLAAATGGAAVVFAKDAPAQGDGPGPYHAGDPYLVNGIDSTAYDDHVVVETTVKTGYVFDPSYGIAEHDEIWDQPLAARQVWEQRHLVAVGVVYPLGVFTHVNHSGYGLLAGWRPY